MRAIDARCGVSADPKLWQLLPCALALSFFYEGWDGQPSALNDDTCALPPRARRQSPRAECQLLDVIQQGRGV